MAAKEANTEQLILDAAEAEFLEKGYGKARTTEIAKRAGVNHAMLHYYFRTKEHLFDVVFQKKVETMSEVLFVSFREELPFLEKIKKGVEEHFDFISANKELPIFIFNEVMNDEKLRKVFINNLKKKVVGVMQQLQDEINKEAAKGTIRQIQAHDLLLTMVSVNVFVFISIPAISEIINLKAEEYNNYIQHRKQINVETILNQLRI